MKKLIATLLALTLALTLGTAAIAEETAPTFMKGVQFNMDMDQVMQMIDLPNPEIENERDNFAVPFAELEYEHVSDYDFTADLSFKFVGNCLVAIHIDLAEGTSYEAVKAELVKTYGETVPFDAAKVGNGRYAIDDDGDLKDCKEMIEVAGATFVLEQDREGDVDVTILDPVAAYINN